MSSYLQYASGYLCNCTEDAFLLQAMVAGMSTDVFLAKGTCSAEFICSKPQGTQYLGSFGSEAVYHQARPRPSCAASSFR